MESRKKIREEYNLVREEAYDKIREIYKCDFIHEHCDQNFIFSKNSEEDRKLKRDALALMSRKNEKFKHWEEQAKMHKTKKKKEEKDVRRLTKEVQTLAGTWRREERRTLLGEIEQGRKKIKGSGSPLAQVLGLFQFSKFPYSSKMSLKKNKLAKKHSTNMK